eukprot:GEMP01000188.1.p1 GENE.GEMP01000188.1~~GEMP01000188.1.p1  ORF type:complete len:2470 (+),score=540.92 GEMP01000188.1:61-7470(+)
MAKELEKGPPKASAKKMGATAKGATTKNVPACTGKEEKTTSEKKKTAALKSAQSAAENKTAPPAMKARGKKDHVEKPIAMDDEKTTTAQKRPRKASKDELTASASVKKSKTNPANEKKATNDPVKESAAAAPKKKMKNVPAEPVVLNIVPRPAHFDTYAKDTPYYHDRQVFSLSAKEIGYTKKGRKCGSMTTLLRNRCCDSEVTVLHKAVLENDTALMEAILKDAVDNRAARPRIVGCVLEKSTCGRVSEFAYGARIRNVNLSRGNAEGNQAFADDLPSRSSNFGCKQVGDLQSDRFQMSLLLYAVKRGASVTALQTLIGLLEKYKVNTINIAASVGAVAARWGFREVALWAVEQAYKNAGYGFNILHVDALKNARKLPVLLPKAKAATVEEKERAGAWWHKKADEGNYRVMPLHCAASCVSIDVFMEVMTRAFPLGMTPSCADLLDDAGRNVLHYAAANRTSPAILRFLHDNAIKLGLDLFAANRFGLTTLMVASMCGVKENVKYILDTATANERTASFINARTKKEKGNDRRQEAVGQTALWYACDRMHADIVTLLVAFGADVNMKNVQQLTPLMRCAQLGSVDCAEALLKHPKIRINEGAKQKKTALHFCAKNGHYDLLLLLLTQQRMIPTICDSSRNNVMHYACGYGWIDIVHFLLHHEPSLAVAENTWKCTPLMVAWMKNHFGIVSYLCAEFQQQPVELAKRALMAVDAEGRSMLHLACANPTIQWIPVVKSLLHCKVVDVNMLDGNAHTCLDLLLKHPMDSDVWKGNEETDKAKEKSDEASKRNDRDAEPFETASLGSALLQLLVDSGAHVTETQFAIALQTNPWLFFQLFDKRPTALSSLCGYLLPHEDAPAAKKTSLEAMTSIEDMGQQNIVVRLLRLYHQANKVIADSDLRLFVTKIENVARRFNVPFMEIMQCPCGDGMVLPVYLMTEYYDFMESCRQRFSDTSYNPHLTRMSWLVGIIGVSQGIAMRSSREAYVSPQICKLSDRLTIYGLPSMNDNSQKTKTTQLVSATFEPKQFQQFPFQQFQYGRGVRPSAFSSGSWILFYDHTCFHKWILRFTGQTHICSEVDILKEPPQFLFAWENNAENSTHESDDLNARDLWRVVKGPFFLDDPRGTWVKYDNAENAKLRIVCCKSSDAYPSAFGGPFKDHRDPERIPTPSVDHNGIEMYYGSTALHIALSRLPLAPAGGLFPVDFLMEQNAELGTRDGLGRNALLSFFRRINTTTKTELMSKFFQILSFVDKPKASDAKKRKVDRTTTITALVTDQTINGESIALLAAQGKLGAFFDAFIRELSSVVDARCLATYVSVKTNLTLLHCAAKNRNELAMRVLLNHKADPHAQDTDGNTPLHLSTTACVDTDSFEVEHLLLSYTDHKEELVNLRNTAGNTALLCALTNACDPVEHISGLLAIKADVTCRDHRDFGVLHLAAKQGGCVALALLVAALRKRPGGVEAELNRVDKNGRCPLAYGVECNHAHVVSLFFQQPEIDINAIIPGVPTSVFSAILGRKWFGLAYLMIERGFSVFQALSDAINSGEFSLASSLAFKNEWSGQTDSVHKHTPLHVFASYKRAFGSDASEMDYGVKIAERLIANKCNVHATNTKGQTALEVALVTSNLLHTKLIEHLLAEMRGTNDGVLGRLLTVAIATRSTGNEQELVDFCAALQKTSSTNPFTCPRVAISLALITGQLACAHHLVSNCAARDDDQVLRCNVVACRVKESGLKKSTDQHVTSPLELAAQMNAHGLMCLMMKKVSDFKAEHKVNNGPHAIMNAARLTVWPYDVDMSFDNGSMLRLILAATSDTERAEVLQTLAKQAKTTNRTFGPRVRAVFLANDIEKSELPSQTPQKPVLPSHPGDHAYIAAAHRYVERKFAEEEVAPRSVCKHYSMGEKVTSEKGVEVVQLPNGKWMDMLGVKVDVKRGSYGENNFYQMQLIREKYKDLYVIFTRWGRIGDQGMFQRTPCESLEHGIKEFVKIAKQKTGYDILENEAPKTKIPGKYSILDVTSCYTKQTKNLLTPFQTTKTASIPAQKSHPLREAVVPFVRSVCDYKLYEHQIKEMGINLESMPVARLTNDTIRQAQLVLEEVASLHQQIDEERQRPHGVDTQLLQQLKTDIMDKSSEFYRLVPKKRFGPDEAISPIDRNELRNEMMHLVNLSDYCVAVKIMLSALEHEETHGVHPLQHCYDCLPCDVDYVSRDSGTFVLVQDYLKHTSNLASTMSTVQVHVYQVTYRYQQAGDKAFDDFTGKRLMLWHGTDAANMLSILSQNYKCAPPEAKTTGHMLGKGVYFAEMASKSLNYSAKSKDNSQYLFLNEVCVGEPTQVVDVNQPWLRTLSAETVDAHPVVMGVGTKGLTWDCSEEHGSVLRMQSGALMPCFSTKKKVIVHFGEAGFMKVNAYKPRSENDEKKTKDAEDEDTEDEDMEEDKKRDESKEQEIKPILAHHEYVVYKPAEQVRIRYIVELRPGWKNA